MIDNDVSPRHLKAQRFWQSREESGEQIRHIRAIILSDTEQIHEKSHARVLGICVRHAKRREISMAVDEEANGKYDANTWSRNDRKKWRISMHMCETQMFSDSLSIRPEFQQ